MKTTRWGAFRARRVHGRPARRLPPGAGSDEHAIVSVTDTQVSWQSSAPLADPARPLPGPDRTRGSQRAWRRLREPESWGTTPSAGGEAAGKGTAEPRPCPGRAPCAPPPTLQPEAWPVPQESASDPDALAATSVALRGAGASYFTKGRPCRTRRGAAAGGRLAGSVPPLWLCPRTRPPARRSVCLRLASSPGTGWQGLPRGGARAQRAGPDAAIPPGPQFAVTPSDTGAQGERALGAWLRAGGRKGSGRELAGTGPAETGLAPPCEGSGRLHGLERSPDRQMQTEARAADASRNVSGVVGDPPMHRDFTGGGYRSQGTPV